MTDAAVIAACQGRRLAPPRAGAFRRGPWPPCIEAADVAWEAIAAPARPGGRVTLARRARASAFPATPYPLRLHRGRGPMAVWRAQA